MKRLGMFTGRIYDSNIKISEIEECCLQIPDEMVDNEEYMKKKKLENTIKCEGCKGCPEVLKYIVKEYNNELI